MQIPLPQPFAPRSVIARDVFLKFFVKCRMIRKSTVLILGAGASWPYGFPLGAGLRKSICDVTSEFQISNLTQTLKNFADIDEGETLDFARQFQRSQVKSIDAFLAKRIEFIDIGKLAIAALLIEKEIPNRIEHPNDAEHWYSYLWNLMIPDIHSINELQNNQIKFITFNYDRSLEYYLHLVMKYAFGVNDAKALEALSKFEILHVYGNLGNFHFHPGSGVRQFSNDMDHQSLRIAANSIEIIPEARRQNKAFERARQICAEAECIGFLGFGFDPLNIERLGLADILKWRTENKKTSPRIVASTFGVTNAEISQFQQQICPSESWVPVKDNCLMTLRESTLLC